MKKLKLYHQLASLQVAYMVYVFFFSSEQNNWALNIQIA